MNFRFSNFGEKSLLTSYCLFLLFFVFSSNLFAQSQNSVADITLDHSVLTSGPYMHGEEVTLRFTASNLGASNAWGVTVNGLLPADGSLTYVRHQTDNKDNNNYYSYQGGNIWEPNYGTYKQNAPGTSYYIDITYRINSTATPIHISNEVAATTKTTDANPTNNKITFVISNAALGSKVVSYDVTTPVIPKAAGIMAISNLKATGNVTGFRFISLPTQAQGILNVNSLPASLGTTYTV